LLLHAQGFNLAPVNLPFVRLEENLTIGDAARNGARSGRYFGD